MGDALLAAGASFYGAPREAGIRGSESARRMAYTEDEIRRILVQEHRTELDRHEDVAEALGMWSRARNIPRGWSEARETDEARRLLGERAIKRYENGQDVLALHMAKILRSDGGRTRARTLDPLIKSQLLYQLSYAPITLDRLVAGRWVVYSQAHPGCKAPFSPKGPPLPGRRKRRAGAQSSFMALWAEPRRAQAWSLFRAPR